MTYIKKVLSWFKPEEKLRPEIATWAKIEYKKDWQFAYNFMINNPGTLPNPGDFK
jgi:hypothetical protein